ncbi:MAG: hypothetical protein ABSA15_07320, partial [Thermoplasmata archaeon]
SGAVHASTTDEILIPLSNGTYPYTISDVPGWHLVQGSAYSGSVAVSGIPAPVVDLTFAETTYEVTFSEQGLPGGTNWSVVVDGQAHASLTSAIEVALANGTHSYTVQPPSGYTANPASGEEVVSGAAATVPIAVASTGGSGSASFPFWIVVVVAGVAVVVVVGVIVLLRRR